MDMSTAFLMSPGAGILFPRPLAEGWIGSAGTVVA